MDSPKAHLFGSTDGHLLEETIGESLRRTVSKFGARPALIVDHQKIRFDYEELYFQTTQAAKSLLYMGIRAGDRVGIWSPNRFEWVVLQFATARIGAILVNINPAYRASELQYALTQSEVKALFLARGIRQTLYQPILESIQEGCPDLEAVNILDEDWDSFLSLGKEIGDKVLRLREEERNCFEPINIQYTSGTTGTPKGATLTHHNILNNGFWVGERLKYTEEDRVCIPVPFYHCFGMVMGNLACITHGAAMVIPGATFDAEQVLATIDRESCTSLYGVPTMFIAELNCPERYQYRLDSLRTGIMAGANCPSEIMKRVRTELHIPQITICYGMTETSPVSTQTLLDDAIEKQVMTVGQVHPFLEIKIIDPVTKETLEIETPGELCTRGYSVMDGYWNDVKATQSAIDSEGWMHSGDLAKIDADGYISIVGRLKDMIIRGGENIYPREIEEFLYAHPSIDEVQVIGISDKTYGETVVAWIRAKEGAELSQESLIEYCHGKIASFKIPKHWKFVDTFPMTITGKIQKFKMREISESEINSEN